MSVRPSRNFWLPAAILAGAVVVLFLVNPAEQGFFPQCLFHKLTGWNCPACGATRAAHALLHARWAEAWRDNALLVLALPAAAGWLVWRGRGVKFSFASRWWWVGLAVAVGFAVWRNLPAGAGFSP